MRNTWWKSGQYNALCDVCGFKFKNTDLRQRWDGLMVCDNDWEIRHPQELIRPIQDQNKLPWTRPEPDNIFVGPAMQNLTINDVYGQVPPSPSDFVPVPPFVDAQLTFTLPIGAVWIGAAWNGSTYCIVNQGTDDAATSAGGLIWTAQSLPTSNGNWAAIAAKGSTFCAVSTNSDSHAATSTDGATWSAQTMPSADSWTDIASNGTVFCALGVNGNGEVATSTTGTTGSWTPHSIPLSTQWWRIASSGSNFFILAQGTSYKGALSTDNGATWVEHDLPSASDVWNGIAGNGLGAFVAVGPNIVTTTPDGVTWTLHPNPPIGTWSNVKFNGQVYCMVSYDGTVAATSPDGQTWTIHNCSQPYINGIGYAMATDGTNFVVVGLNSGNKGLLITP